VTTDSTWTADVAGRWRFKLLLGEQLTRPA
jgi:hypothetical protein